MAFIGRRFQSADLLLGRAYPFGKLLLRKAGFLSQGGQFQRDIPCFPGFFEAFGKNHILELFLKISVEICFSFHCGCLTNQSRFRVSSIRNALVASTINSPLNAGSDLTRAMTVSLKSLVSGIFPISPRRESDITLAGEDVIGMTDNIRNPGVQTLSRRFGQSCRLVVQLLGKAKV